MKKTIITLILLLGAIFVGTQMSKDSGYVLMTFQHWSFEMNLWVFLFFTLIIFLILHIGFNLLSSLKNLPKTFHQWRHKRQKKHSEDWLTKGLIAFNEGYYPKAEKYLNKSLPNTSNPLIHYQLLANIAEQKHQPELRDHYLRKAEKALPEASFGIALTQSEYYIANQQWEQAIATLKHLDEKKPNHPRVLKNQFIAYQQVKDWEHLIALLPKLSKNHLVDDAILTPIEIHANIMRLQEISKSNPDALTSYLKHLPKKLRNNPNIINAYATTLSALDPVAAKKMILKELYYHYSPELIQLYLELASADDYKLMEHYLTKHDKEISRYYFLTKIALHEKNWEKAREYVGEELKHMPNSEAYRTAGYIYESLGNKESALYYFKQSASFGRTNIPEITKT